MICTLFLSPRHQIALIPRSGQPWSRGLVVSSFSCFSFKGQGHYSPSVGGTHLEEYLRFSTPFLLCTKAKTDGRSALLCSWSVFFHRRVRGAIGQQSRHTAPLCVYCPRDSVRRISCGLGCDSSQSSSSPLSPQNIVQKKRRSVVCCALSQQCFVPLLRKETHIPDLCSWNASHLKK